MLIKNWNCKLNEAINEVYKKYSNSNKSILTEGDLENLLFHYCACKNLPIHSQITWFKDDKKSGFEVDLTILNEENLYVEKFDELDKLFYNFEYPHKGYFYDGEIIGIEIKFIRNNINFKKNILCDLIKVNEKIIPHKKNNINNQLYKISDLENVKFHIIIGFKEFEKLTLAKKILKKYLDDNLELKQFVQLTIFSPNKIFKYNCR